MSDRKVCVVTGSSSGIGAATARLYAERGWNVAINYSREAAPAERVADECRALGRRDRGQGRCRRRCGLPASRRPGRGRMGARRRPRQ